MSSFRERKKRWQRLLHAGFESKEAVLLREQARSNWLYRLTWVLIFTLLTTALVLSSRSGLDRSTMVGIALLVILVNLCGWVGIARFYPEVTQSVATFYRFIGLLIGFMMLAWVLLLLGLPKYMVPVALLVVPLSLTYSQPLAIYVTLGVGVFLGLMSPDLPDGPFPVGGEGAGDGSGYLLGMVRAVGVPVDLSMAFTTILGGVVFIVGLERIRRYTKPLAVGLYAGVVQGAVIVASQLMFPSAHPILGGHTGLVDDLREFLKGPGWGLLGGAVSGAIITCVLPAMEHIFNIVTERRLLDLADPNNELMRTLVSRAPGTFTHSQTVAHLASEAADAIGANPLLARVGAYYHDIGKIYKPEYFIENTQEGRSIHDRLKPEMSKLIIISHVKDGIGIAEEEKLPQKIIDMIPMHHGTTVVEYFYHKARTGEKGQADIESYRYPGPRPRFKEAGILMLADSVQAISRTLSEATPARIQSMVHEVVRRRLTEGELDESNLTMRDLRAIEDSFVRTLSGLYHRRIEYPKGSPEPGRRRREAAPGAGQNAPRAGQDAPRVRQESPPGSREA